MATNSTLLCIHRDPAQLSLLEDHGYELVTATNGHDGLRLFMSRPVDAIVLDYQLGLLDGAVVATEIKQVKPQIPIVMLTDNVELPQDALNSIDALVTKSDGDYFLLAAVHFVLNVKPFQSHEAKLRGHIPAHLHWHDGSQVGAHGAQVNTSQLVSDEKDAPVSPKVWGSIRDDGSVEF